MKVLLTGSAGFIGTAIAESLTAAGHQVVGVDALIPQAHAGGEAAPPGTHVHDVRDVEAWSPLLAGVDVVCHQASLVGIEAGAEDLPGYAAHNDLGTAAVLAAMAGSGTRRLVLASSMVVYGEGRYECAVHGPQEAGPRGPERLDGGDFEHACPRCGAALAWALVGEDARVDPRSGYAAGKVAQEHYAAAWARLTGGSVLALRYHNVYGPGMPGNTPYSGVAAMFRSALEAGRAPRVFEDGAQMRDFVHVSDVARANLAALEAVLDAPAGRARAYNVCSGHPVSISQVASLLGGTGPTAPVVTGGYRLGDVRHIVADPTRATAELGFTARVTPQIGLPGFATAPLR